LIIKWTLSDTEEDIDKHKESSSSKIYASRPKMYPVCLLCVLYFRVIRML